MLGIGKRGQSTAIDIVLVLISITIFLSIIMHSFEEKTLRIGHERIRSDYTKSLLISMMQCTTNDSNRILDGKRYSDLVAIYFANISNTSKLSIEKKIENHINEYLGTRNNWIFYSSDGIEKMSIPSGKNITSGEFSSASTEIALPDGNSIRAYLWIEWSNSNV